MIEFQTRCAVPTVIGTETTDGKHQNRGRKVSPPIRPAGLLAPATKPRCAAEALLDGEAVALTHKAIDKAKEGDTVGLRLCLDRILPLGRNVLCTSPCRLSLRFRCHGCAGSDHSGRRRRRDHKRRWADLNAVVAGLVKAVETSDIEGPSLCPRKEDQ
jgi:hypothetical protein